MPAAVGWATDDNVAMAQPAVTARWSRGRAIALSSAAVIALTSLQLARQPGTRSWQSIWAEDGAVYGREALGLPLWRTLFRGYGGYVQLVPRLLASLVGVVGVSGVAILFAVSSALVTAVLALFVFRCTADWIDDVGLRAVVAAMTALVPIAYFETNNNIANLGWPLLVASCWAIVSRRRAPVDTGLRAGVLVATALSTTVAALLAPAALLLAVRRRRRSEWIVVSCFSLALALQLVLDRTAQASPSTHDSASAGDLFQVFGVRVIGGLVVGERWLYDAWRAWHYGVVLVAAVVLAALALACRRAGPDRWWLAAASLVMAFAVFAAPVWVRGSTGLRLRDSGLTPAGARYFVAPVVLLVGGVAVLVDGSGRAWLRRLVVVHAVVVVVVGFQLANLRSISTPWDQVVRHAQEECRAKPGDALERLAISPPNWVMPVTCAHVG